MFTTDMLESQQKEVRMNQFDSDTLERIILFAYTGKIRISTNNVQSLLSAANFLQLTPVQEHCANFLNARLNTANVLGIRALAATYNCQSIMKVADRFIQKHFLTVAQSEEFLNLDVDSVISILSKDELFVDNEEQVFEISMKWLQHDLPNRAIHSHKLLATVRLTLLKPHFITDEVCKHPIVRSSLVCRDLIDEAKDYHLIPERRALMRTFRTKQRCCHDVPGIVYAIGGLNTANDVMSMVEIFDPLSRKWSIAKSMGTVRSRVGVAVMQRKLYAIGGFNGIDRLRTVEVFDAQKSTWSEVAPLNNKRSALCAAALGECLYVCGGYDGISSLSTVEIFNPSTNKWKFGKVMKRQRCAAGVAVIGGCLYIMGGHDGMSIFNSVERYNSEKDDWESVSPMLSKRCRLGAVAFDGKIYVAGGYDGTQFLRTAEVYDPDKDTWTYISPMILKRSRVSLVVNNGLIYAIAGYDGDSNLSSMEIYRPNENIWTLGPNMIAHEGGVGVGVIPISPEQL
uniref:BTB domain-containing protein n=1 Tax=Acrobeloides nanus TaxID=290746 RepID=A0A914CAG8_9BILA